MAVLVNVLAATIVLALVAISQSAVKKRVAPLYHLAHVPQQTLVVYPKKEKGQDLSKIPGVPGVDYPLYHEVPPTNFHCGKVPFAPGIYANVETGCQAYHICHDGREGHQGASFLCTNGTLFNQHEFTCDWWYNVNCADAPKLYELNLDPYKNPFVPKPKKEEVLVGAPHPQVVVAAPHAHVAIAAPHPQVVVAAPHPQYAYHR